MNKVEVGKQLDKLYKTAFILCKILKTESETKDYTVHECIRTVKYFYNELDYSVSYNTVYRLSFLVKFYIKRFNKYNDENINRLNQYLDNLKLEIPMNFLNDNILMYKGKLLPEFLLSESDYPKCDYLRTYSINGDNIVYIDDLNHQYIICNKADKTFDIRRR